MDREHVRGAVDKVKGAIKETAGKVSGDKELESEGKVGKAKQESNPLKQQRALRTYRKSGTLIQGVGEKAKAAGRACADTLLVVSQQSSTSLCSRQQTRRMIVNGS